MFIRGCVFISACLIYWVSILGGAPFASKAMIVGSVFYGDVYYKGVSIIVIVSKCLL